MATVTFRRTDNPASVSIVDGQLVFDTTNYKIYMDNGNTRLQYGGDTDIISNPAEATPTNVFSASYSLNLFTQKTTTVDTVTDALAVTQNYIPLGCLAFKEALGTTNFSNVGNGTISGGLVALRGETLTGTLTAGETSLVLTSSIVNASSYIDVYTDTYGVVPTDVSVDNSNRQITLTFKVSAVPIGVKIVVRNM